MKRHSKGKNTVLISLAASPMVPEFSFESAVSDAQNIDLQWCQKTNSHFFARLIHPLYAI